MPRRGPGFFVGNTIKAPYCTISAADPTYEPVGFEATFLKTEKPSDTARISTLDPLKTRWTATFTGGSGRVFQSLVAINSNLSPWGHYRFTGNIPDWEVLAPTAIASSNNRTGVVGNVDEPLSSIDGNYMVPTNTLADWSVALTYPTPSSTPTSKLFVAIRVELVGVPDTLYPKANIGLYQSGDLIRAETRAVTETSGQTYFLAVDSIDILAPGNNLEVRLDFEIGSDGAYARLATALIYVEGPVPLLDSGWIQSPIADQNSDDDTPPTLDLPYYPEIPWNLATEIYLNIVDDQVNHDPDTAFAAFGVPIGNVDVDQWLDGYIEAGVWFAGDAIFISSVGMTVQDRGPRSSVHIEEIGGVSGGGQSRGTDLFRQRRCRLDFIASRDELLSLQRRVAWGRGRSGAFYFAAEPDLPVKYQVFSSFWCTLQDMGEPELVLTADDTDDGGVLHRVSMTLLEKI